MSAVATTTAIEPPPDAIDSLIAAEPIGDPCDLQAVYHSDLDLIRVKRDRMLMAGSSDCDHDHEPTDRLSQLDWQLAHETRRALALQPFADYPPVLRPPGSPALHSPALHSTSRLAHITALSLELELLLAAQLRDASPGDQQAAYAAWDHCREMMRGLGIEEETVEVRPAVGRGWGGWGGDDDGDESGDSAGANDGHAFAVGAMTEVPGFDRWAADVFGI